MKKSIKVFHWLPRVICMLAILFVSLFAADAFEPGLTIWQQLGAFLMHLIPSFILLAFLIIAWKWEKIGGIIFIVIGLLLSPFIFQHNYNMNHSIGMSFGIILVITFPFVIVGILFIVSHFIKKKNILKTKNVFTIIGLTILLTFLCACATENKIAHEKFISGKPKMLVCPVHILANQNSSYDTISSKKIVEYINGKKYADAGVTQLVPPANNEWKANEAKMLTISIDLFIEFVKKNNFPDDTYILNAEFLKSGQNATIRAVHYCLLNSKGEVAMRGLINSHWDEFKKVNPKTDEDCIAVFINGFEGKMKKK